MEVTVAERRRRRRAELWPEGSAPRLMTVPSAHRHRPQQSSDDGSSVQPPCQARRLWTRPSSVTASSRKLRHQVGERRDLFGWRRVAGDDDEGSRHVVHAVAEAPPGLGAPGSVRARPTESVIRSRCAYRSSFRCSEGRARVSSSRPARSDREPRRRDGGTARPPTATAGSVPAARSDPLIAAGESRLGDQPANGGGDRRGVPRWHEEAGAAGRAARAACGNVGRDDGPHARRRPRRGLPR